MSFKPNPLSLTIPDPTFENWLRDSGYLELLDHHSSTTTTNTATATATSAATSVPCTTKPTIPSAEFFFSGSLFSFLTTLFSLLTLNPFAKLTTGDFAAETASWTNGFLGCLDSYAFPSSPTQARLRVQENVKRFARNYATLFIVFFACTLYQMPLALAGLLASLALWDLIRFGGDRWGLDQHPAVRLLLVRVAQCAAAVILVYCNVQMALFCAIAVSYSVLILHAALRKLTPAKQNLKKRSR